MACKMRVHHRRRQAKKLKAMLARNCTESGKTQLLFSLQSAVEGSWSHWFPGAVGELCQVALQMERKVLGDAWECLHITCLQNIINFINRVAFGSPVHLVMFEAHPHHMFQQHLSQKPFKKAEKAFTREIMILNFNRICY